MSFLGLKNPFATGAGAVTRAAQDATAARQGRASNLTTLTNNVFSDPRREAGITDFMGALRAQAADTTNRGFADTSRKTKFATARQGLTGGRVDVDRQRNGLEDLFKRRIADESQVQDAGNQLRDQDFATRQSLINQAYSTADTGQDAARGMIGQQGQNSNYLSSLLPGLTASIGGDLAGAYSRRAEMNSFRRGMGGAGGGAGGGASGTYAWNTPTFNGGYANG